VYPPLCNGSWDCSRAVQVTAVAYDNPIPGYGTNNTINLRLWAAKPDREFDLEAFNTGDYIQVCLDGMRLASRKVPVTERLSVPTCLCASRGCELLAVQAILSKQRAETLSSVLYPDDRTYEGKELRLKQQHFFVSATIQVPALIQRCIPDHGTLRTAVIGTVSHRSLRADNVVGARTWCGGTRRRTRASTSSLRRSPSS